MGWTARSSLGVMGLHTSPLTESSQMREPLMRVLPALLMAMIKSLLYQQGIKNSPNSAIICPFRSHTSSPLVADSNITLVPSGDNEAHNRPLLVRSGCIERVVPLASTIYKVVPRV